MFKVLELVPLAIFVSLIVQAIKSKAEGEYSTLTALAILSLCAVHGACRVGYWETVYKVLLTAGAVYAFVIQRYEAKAGAEPAL